MGWVTPPARATGLLVTDAIWNQDIKDNTRYLKGMDGAVTIEDDIYIYRATSPTMRLSEASSTTSYMELTDSGARGVIRKVEPTGGALIDIDPLAADGTSTQNVRLFRSSGSSGVTSLQVFLGDGTSSTNAQIGGQGANTYFAANNGSVCIGTAALNSVNDRGLTIDQGSSDFEILSLKSSDVAHGVTAYTETSTFGRFSKQTSTGGGLWISGIAESAGPVAGMRLEAVGNLDTGKTTSADGIIQINCYDNDGTINPATPGVNSNLLVVRRAATTRFILDADGDSHQDVGTAWTNFDDEDDIAMANLLAAHVTRQDDPLQAGFGLWLERNRAPLERAKLVTFNEDGHHFVNMSRLTMLLTGAVRQLGARVEHLEQRLLAA